jgi:hypothetical protein
MNQLEEQGREEVPFILGPSWLERAAVRSQKICLLKPTNQIHAVAKLQ